LVIFQVSRRLLVSESKSIHTQQKDQWLFGKAVVGFFCHDRFTSK
jgi:hypothetical protein